MESLHLVAAGYETQVASLPSYVHIPDEIAITFGDCALSADQIQRAGLIDQSTRNEIDALDGHLDRMSEDKSIWTMEALRGAAEWSDARELACNLLARLGQTPRKPNLYWVAYAPSRRVTEEEALKGIEFDEDTKGGRHQDDR